MTLETFEDSLRTFLRGEPFQQFVIELLDGRSIVVDAPHTVSMGGGAACFISPDLEIHMFSCEQVQGVHLLNGKVVP